MNENENLVTEEVAENVEQTTEETPEKTFTQSEMNDIMGKRLARQEARIRKEYERKQRENDELVETLKAGTGKQTVKELDDTFTKFYESKGIKITKKPVYTDKDIETLARADADDIIQGGYEEVVEEVDRLANSGNLSPRDKAVFNILAEHRQNAERSRELASIGITEDVYNSKEFKDFASKFNPNTPIADIYDIYNKTIPKKEYKTMGSMKHVPNNNGVKDYYSPEEIERMTEEDLDDPKVWEAVRRSMTGG